jgi:hypothetical protein
VILHVAERPCLTTVTKIVSVESFVMAIYSKTSLIGFNWEQTLAQISESLNYRSATENMFRKVIKWTSCVSLGITTFRLHIIK